MKKLVLVVAVLVAGLLFAQAIRVTPVANRPNDRSFAEKVNLALRRTAHHLLLEKGDSTSRIPPVQRRNSNTFYVRLEHAFDYDRLPALLHESLSLHQIVVDYDVAVLDCTQGELQLGYNYRDFTEKNEVPCGGRQLGRGCYILQVTLTAPEPTPQPVTRWWLAGFACLLAGGFIFWRWSTSTKTAPDTSEGILSKPDQLHFGKSSLDMTNQTLVAGAVRHSLTYREAKLLHLFVGRPNQVLDRDFILKSVWEDEGVIVGRSVDVFVSRLRKLLQDDPAVRILAVHGVGYRLEVREGVGNFGQAERPSAI